MKPSPRVMPSPSCEEGKGGGGRGVRVGDTEGQGKGRAGQVRRTTEAGREEGTGACRVVIMRNSAVGLGLPSMEGIAPVSKPP